MAKSKVFPNGREREALPADGFVKGNPFKARGSGVTCDVGSADRSVIIAAIGTCVAAGVLLTIGGAQGGRGYMVSVYCDGAQHRDYASNNDELRELLICVIDAYASSAEDVYQVYGIGREG